MNTTNPSQPVCRKPSLPGGSETRIRRQRLAGLDLVVAQTGTLSELHLTLTPRGAETPEALAERLAAVLGEWNAVPVRQFVFGAVAAFEPFRLALQRSLPTITIPMICVAGGSCRNQTLAGIQVHAISGVPVRVNRSAAGVQSVTWEDARATHRVLTTTGPGGALGMSRSEQAAGALQQWHEELAAAGWTMKNVARTWFYLEEILAWYGDFNHVRNDLFARCELRSGHVPASTGVSGYNPAHTALAAAAWALQPHDATVPAFEFIASPRQCPAPSYGSAFSRAVEIHSAGFRQLLVSGTASIAPDGKTAHVGDIHRQIDLSMQVVREILASRAMSFADVSRATAYFATPGDVAAWEQWQRAQGLDDLPVVCACCDICRDDLLFEIELDALKSDRQ